MSTNIKKIKDYIMSGLSYVLPVIIASSLITGITRITGYFLGAPQLNVFKEQTGFFHYLYLIEQAGWRGIGLLNIVLGGFIAYSTGGRAALAAGLIAGALAIDRGAGFPGAVIGGLFAGWITLKIKERIKFPEIFQAAMPLIFLPLFTVGLTVLLMIFVIGEPLSRINSVLTAWITVMLSKKTNAVFIALILGGMMGTDLGGPVNKSAWAPAQALFVEGIYLPKIFVNMGAAIPPLGYGLACLIKKQKFSDEFRQSGHAALIMGIIGITEGAIPFTLKKPVKMVPVNIVGSAVGSAIGAFLGVSGPNPPISGVYGFFSVGNPFAYLAGIFSGALIIAAGAVIFGEFTENDESTDETEESIELEFS